MIKIRIPFKDKPLAFVFSLMFLTCAAFLRFVFLDNKPIHFDESINMWFVQRILEDGYFTYDPTNYHGPLLFYLIHFLQIFTGFDFLSTRWVAAIFSFLTLVLLWFGPIGHRKAFRWASVLLLFSPAMGFFGRSGIHESTFVFFQVLGFLSFHHLVEKDYKKFWYFFAASLLGMLALKETFVILILALVPAVAIMTLTEKQQVKYALGWMEIKQSFRQRDVHLPILAMFLLFTAVYSGFGSNPKGLIDFFVALMPWLKTSIESGGHVKEFLYWSKLMAQYEFATLTIFFVGCFFVVHHKWIRFYFLVALVLWLVYSLIPYKTPWCLISILWPFTIVAGMAIERLIQRLSGGWKYTPALGVCFLCLGEAKIHYDIVYRDPIDLDHPYVYVNSTYQLKEFIQKTSSLIEEQPLLREQVVQIGTGEPWPFPIVFAKFYDLSYFKANTKIVDDALIYMVDPADRKLIDEKLKKDGRSEQYQMFLLDVRQSRAPIFVYVKKEQFQNLFSWELKDVGSL